jgi:hypothetical protein
MTFEDFNFTPNDKIPPMPKPFVDFFAGRRTDHRGRSLDDLQDLDYDALHAAYDHLPWMFPSPERSSLLPEIPALTDEDVAAFRSNDALRMKLNTSFRIMMRFYGLDIYPMEKGWFVTEIPSFDERAKIWLKPGSQHYLRLAHIMRSLATLGMPHYARALLTGLERIYRSHGAAIGPEVLADWRAALPSTESAGSDAPQARAQ